MLYKRLICKNEYKLVYDLEVYTSLELWHAPMT